jgi:hypothetical protein
MGNEERQDVWGSYSYPSSYHQFYRNWDPASGSASAVFDISAWAGAARTARTAAMDIAVDANNTVWIVAHGPQSWVEHLARSAAPYAEGLEFVDAGAISPGASAQTTRIAIDPSGRVHCAFYRNTGAGQYEHRIYDPAAGWGDSTNLGNATPENDIWGSLAADGLGNVHVLFIEDGTDASPLWRFLYRRWEEASGWGEPVTLLEVEAAARTGIADTHIIALACDESTGEVAVLYRDLNRGGPLGVVRKSLDDVGFGDFLEIAPPATVQNAYCSPSIRGRLFPESDRTAHGLHLTWQHRPVPGVPPYSLLFAALEGSEGARFRRADADGSGKLDLTDAISTLQFLYLGDTPPACMDAADTDDSGKLDLTDAISSLQFQFMGGPPPADPGPTTCGPDPTTGDGYTECAYPSC